MPSKNKVHVQVKYEVHYTLEVHVSAGECPIDKISSRQLFGYQRCSYKGKSFGMDNSVLRELGVEVVETRCAGQARPTGKKQEGEG